MMSPETIIIIFLGVALLVTIFVLLLINKAKSAARKELASANAELERVQSQTATLQKKVQTMASRTYLSEFEAEKLYTLLASKDLDLNGETVHYGVVRDEDGKTCVFLTPQSLEDIEVHDTFLSVRGQIAKLVSRAAARKMPASERAEAKSLESEEAVSRQQPLTESVVEETVLYVPPTQAQEIETVLNIPPREAADKETEFYVAPTIVSDDKTVLSLKTRDQAQIQREWNAGLTHVKVLEGVDEGAVFYLPYVKATLGREQSCTVPLNDKSCSHQHSVIEYDGIGFLLRDNNSTNGTFCNGDRIGEKILEFGDRISIGDTTLLFTCEGFELKDTDPQKAIEAFEQCLERQPDFLAALKNLAFLLERDIARATEAQPLWDKIIKLEKRR